MHFNFLFGHSIDASTMVCLWSRGEIDWRPFLRKRGNIEYRMERGGKGEAGGGLIVNEVGNLSLSWARRLLLSSQPLGCSTPLLPYFLLLLLLLVPPQHPFENFRRRDDSSSRSIIPTPGHFRFYLTHRPKTGVHVPKGERTVNGKQLVGFCEKWFGDDASAF